MWIFRTRPAPDLQPDLFNWPAQRCFPLLLCFLLYFMVSLFIYLLFIHCISIKYLISNYLNNYEKRDIKAVIRDRRPQTDRQQNSQNKKDKQRSTKHYTENERLNNTRTRGELCCSGRVSISCSSSRTSLAKLWESALSYNSIICSTGFDPLFGAAQWNSSK